MNSEEIEARSQAWYVEHGYLTIATTGPMYRVGDDVHNEWTRKRDRFLGKYRWRVVGKASRADLKKEIAAIGIATCTPKEFTHFYRIEAMD